MQAEEQMKAWTEEQLEIASRVRVPESPAYFQVQEASEGRRYRFARPSIGYPLLVGGVDVSFMDEGDDAIAVYVVLKYNAFDSPPEVVHRSHKWYELTMPYIPSYLAFREIGPLQELISNQIESSLELKPDVILVDGNGMWHGRKAGIATFVGVRTGIPTIGVGKTFYSIDGLMRKDDVHRDVRRGLKSWYERAAVSKDNACLDEKESEKSGDRCLVLDTVPIPVSSDDERSSTAEEITDDEILTALHRAGNGLAIPMKGGVNNDDEVLAYALVGHGGNVRANKNAKRHDGKGSKVPIYISVGSNISLEDAVALCSSLCIARIPEPVREADLYGRELVRKKQAG